MKSVAITPPIRVSSAPSPRNVTFRKPTSESFDVMVHECKAGESYRSISQQVFSTPVYAAALQMFNRNFWQASDLIKRDGEIVPGEKIFIPPIRILEERHGVLIHRESPGETPPGGAGGGVPTRGVPEGMPGRVQ